MKIIVLLAQKEFQMMVNVLVAQGSMLNLKLVVNVTNRVKLAKEQCIMNVLLAIVEH
jgi:hypothetical protein